MSDLPAVACPFGSRRTPAQGLVLLCGKCARKLDGGYGDKGKDGLKTALRRALREAGHGRDVRIVETKCLGLCPRRATTMIVGHNPGEMLAVPRKAAMDEVVQHVIPIT